jgi:hypothetical protein
MVSGEAGRLGEFVVLEELLDVTFYRLEVVLAGELDR